MLFILVSTHVIPTISVATYESERVNLFFRYLEYVSAVCIRSAVTTKYVYLFSIFSGVLQNVVYRYVWSKTVSNIVSRRCHLFASVFRLCVFYTGFWAQDFGVTPKVGVACTMIQATYALMVQAFGTTQFGEQYTYMRAVGWFRQNVKHCNMLIGCGSKVDTYLVCSQLRLLYVYVNFAAMR